MKLCVSKNIDLKFFVKSQCCSARATHILDYAELYQHKMFTVFMF